MPARWKPGDTWRSPVAVAARTQARKLVGTSKTRGIAATHKSQASCPPDCPLKDNICLAETRGTQPFTTRRLNSAAETDPDKIAEIEAILIDQLPADRDLRTQVVGDSRTPTAATITGSAMVRYDERSRASGHHGKAWTYTHAWKIVPFAAWAGARVIASCHTMAEVAHAEERGYPTALMSMDPHASRKRYTVADRRFLPCPQQFKDSKTTCENCPICKDPTNQLQNRQTTLVFQNDHLPKR